MDKTEYHLKLDEINKLVEAQDYEGALEIADSIDWRRVKSVRTLCMVAEIYEVNDELEESMKMLQLAYKRSSLGKMILYRQVELALKMGLYDDAVKYYNQYLETASNDTSKYILKYKIYKAQKAPLEDQIAILEEYKEREYTERWVYELARLYKLAGQEEKCIETCDDLALWFGDGKYVTKAMELKMSYTSLSSSQKEKYEKTMMGTAAVVSGDKSQGSEVPIAAVPGISAAAMASLQKAVENRAQEAAAAMEGTDTEISEIVEETETPQEAPVEAPQDVPHIDAEKLQERLSRSFQEILSGFNRTKAIDAFEALGRAVGTEMPEIKEEEENIEDYHVQDLEPETVNEGKISAEKGEAIASRTDLQEPEVIETPQEEKTEDKEIVSVQEVDLDALFAETSSSLAKEAGGEAVEETAEETLEEIPEPKVVESEPIEEVAEENLSEEDVAEESISEEILEAEKAEESAVPGSEVDAEAEAAMAAFEASLSGGIFAEDISEEVAATEENEDVTVDEDSEEPVAEESEEESFEEIGSTQVLPNLSQESWNPSVGDTQEFNLEDELRAALGIKTEEEKEEPELNQIEQMLAEAEAQPNIEELVVEKETPEEKRQRILNNTRPERLTADQKQLFSYFSKIPGMDEQILNAIQGVYNHADEKTSRRGNIAIMGSHGTGKTRLSESLVKAICKGLGIQAVKYANLDASDMNRKDPAAIINKMAGGFLLIERASYMSQETIEKLSHAMEFRTDSMILLIEDDKANMRRMLADYPEFAEKFATVISIPVFTNDELVSFARTYARENGYRMDEMGVLALYTMIGDNQREDEPITIGKVKEMVDGAIQKASGAKLGRKISKRHTDEEGRILLYEKDFEG